MATKTGGSLLGRADSTLVQGALKAELANISPNMQGVYKMQAENIGNLQTAIQDIFYATNKSNNDLYNDIKEQSGLILADIESGTFSDDTSIDLYTNAINDLRNQAKSIPKGKKGEAQRAKIRAQLAKMKADSANGEGVITEIATLIDNDQISQYAVNENDLKLFKDILSGDAKREITNGELVYSTVDASNNPIKINHNELNKRFIKKDYTVETNALKLSGGFSKIGLQGTKYDFNEALNSYENLMTTRDGFMHLINKPFGTMKISFAQALQGGDTKLVGEMMGALNSIGGVDVDGDGTPDQITKENYKKLADILTNPDAANFSVAKRAAAAFYADNDGRAQHKKGYDIYLAKLKEQESNSNPTKSKTYSPNMNLGGGVNTNTLISYISDLESGTIINPRDGQKYNVNSDNSWTNDAGNTISGNDMINALQYFEFEKQGYTFDDEGNELTKGAKRPYFFVNDIQFKPFSGTSVKQNEEDFLPPSATIKDVEVKISEQKNYSQVVNTINDILKDYKIDSSKNAQYGGTFSRNTITFNGQQYDLSSYFGKNKNEKQKQEGEQNLKDLIAAVQAFVGGRELP
mgnify:CR=1 FL=1